MPLQRLGSVVFRYPSSGGDAIPVTEHGVPDGNVGDVWEALFDGCDCGFEAAGELGRVCFEFVPFSGYLEQVSLGQTRTRGARCGGLQEIASCHR